MKIRDSIVLLFVAVYLIGLAFVSGLVVGLAKHSSKSPADMDQLPLCSEWGLLQPTPHKPDDPWMCRKPLKLEPVSTSKMMRRDI